MGEDKKEPATATEPEKEPVEKKQSESASEYRKGFESITLASGLNDVEKSKFATKYFGQPIESVREFARLWLTARSTPVGDAGAAPSSTTPAVDDERVQLVARFSSLAHVRESLGCFSSDANSVEYTTVLKRYLASHGKK